MNLAYVPAGVDLIHSLKTGSDMLLCTYPVAYRPTFYELGPLSCGIATGYDPSAFRLLDPRLTTICSELQYFSCLVNSSHSKKEHRSASEFQKAICAFQYRLS